MILPRRRRSNQGRDVHGAVPGDGAPVGVDPRITDLDGLFGPDPELTDADPDHHRFAPPTPAPDQPQRAPEAPLIIDTEWAFPVHQLRCGASDFDSIQSGTRPFDIRSAAHGFQSGDLALLRYWAPTQGYTGEYCVRRVCSVLANHPAVAHGFVVIGLAADVTPDIVVVREPG